MTTDAREFLASSVRIAKVSVRRKNGRPWVQPVWFGLDEDQLIFVVAQPSLLHFGLKREGQMAVCVDELDPPFGFVAIRGPVELSADVDDAVLWQERLIRRYRDDVPDPAAHARMLAREYGGVLARLTPSIVHFEPAVALVPQGRAAR